MFLYLLLLLSYNIAYLNGMQSSQIMREFKDLPQPLLDTSEGLWFRSGLFEKDTHNLGIFKDGKKTDEINTEKYITALAISKKNVAKGDRKVYYAVPHEGVYEWTPNGGIKKFAEGDYVNPVYINLSEADERISIVDLDNIFPNTETYEHDSKYTVHVFDVQGNQLSKVIVDNPALGQKNYIFAQLAAAPESASLLEANFSKLKELYKVIFPLSYRYVMIAKDELSRATEGFLFDLETQEKKCSLRGTELIRNIVTAEDRYLVTNNSEEMRVWNLEKNKIHVTFKGVPTHSCYFYPTLCPDEFLIEDFDSNGIVKYNIADRTKTVIL